MPLYTLEEFLKIQSYKVQNWNQAYREHFTSVTSNIDKWLLMEMVIKKQKPFILNSSWTS